MKKRSKSFYIFLSLILLVSITLGYAFLSRTLNINGNTRIEKNSWVIYFDDVDIANDSVENEDPSKDARIVNREKTNIEFTANLSNPGDFYEFTVYTVNDGSIDAAISSIEKSLLSESEQKYLTYEVKYDNGEEIKKCDILHSGERRLIKAIVKYKDNAEIGDYPVEPVHLNLFFRINYEQNVECEEEQKEKEYVLTIRPNGGKYEERTSIKRVYLKEDDEYTLSRPTRELYNFTGWEVIEPEEGTYTFENNKITMGKENVVIEATWEEGDYVARIENTYYKTVQEAFNEVDGDWRDNTVYLVKSTEEDPVNNANNAFTFNLGGLTLRGKATNNNEISLVNGKIINTTEEAVLNNGKVNVGIDDGTVEVNNSISIIGKDYGLKNENEFYFYDGYIEGTRAAYIGDNTGRASGHYIVVDHMAETDSQRAYLVSNPNRAVVKITTEGDKYFYNLQDAINYVEEAKKADDSLTDEDYKLEIIRSFEAAYELKTEEERVIIDTKGYTITVGDKITNNSYLKLVNSTENNSRISIAKPITNTGGLVINNVNVSETTDSNVINNSGNISVENSTISGKKGYAINNTGNGTIDIKDTAVVKSEDNYGLKNSGNIRLTGGKIYGFENSGTTEITGGEYISAARKSGSPSSCVNANLYAIYNTGTLNLRGGTVTNTKTSENIANAGTVNYYDGEISDNHIAISNSSSCYYSGGTVNVYENEIYSTETNAITNGTTNVLGGTVTGEAAPAIYGSNVKITSGLIKSETSSAITGYSNSVRVEGGTIEGETNGIDIDNSSSATIVGGLVKAENIGVKVNTLNISGGKIESSNIGAVVSSSNVSGGEIEAENTGLSTNSITMTNGNITSNEEVGVVINNTGTIKGGNIEGKTYGVDSKGTLTLGENDDGEISITSPVLKGNSYGLYIEGNTTNFYDGILKGEIDGYTGLVTGLPLGGVVTDGNEEIDGVEFETDYVSAYENWLRIGNNEYNSLNAASLAAEEGDIIYVTKDALIKFTQEIKDKDYEITIDLNGHEVELMQTITNKGETTLKNTLVEEDKGESGKLLFTRNTGIINDNRLIVDSGEYESTVGIVINNNGSKTLIQNGGTLKTSVTAVNNNGTFRMNGGKIEASIGVSGGSVEINGTKDNDVYSTEIIASDVGIRESEFSRSSIVINGGHIKATNNAVSNGIITVNKENENNATLIESTNGYGVYSHHGEITINNGDIKSENYIGVEGHRDTVINGGRIEAPRGYTNAIWYSETGYSVWWYTMTINGGEIIGTTSEGTYVTGGTLYMYGGTTRGKVNGLRINSGANAQLGRNDGTISVESPLVVGEEVGVRSEGYFKFFDGILKGKANDEIEGNKGHTGIISLTPDGTTVKEDYEYIDRVKYDTEYLVSAGNWLRVGSAEFNSINAAAAVIEETGTIEVIKNATVTFEQYMPEGKNITFDLQGHSVNITQGIEINGNDTIIDSVGNGSLHNVREEALTVNENGILTIKSGSISTDSAGPGAVNVHAGGKLIVEDGTLETFGTNTSSEGNPVIRNNGETVFYGGTLKAKDDYAVQNSGTFIMESGTIETYGGISTRTGTVTINDGTIKGTNTYSIYSTTNAPHTVINDGEILNDVTESIFVEGGYLTINGGEVRSTADTAVHIHYHYDPRYIGHLIVNDGEIEGANYGVLVSHSGDSLEINGGHIKGNNNDGVYTTCSSTILGGIIEGANHGVRTSAHIQLGNDDGTVSIDTPILKGEYYGLYFESTVNFYDGIMKGGTNWYNGEITNIPARTEIFYDEEEIDGKTYQTANLLAEQDIAINLRTEELYNNLQDALDEAEENDTIKLIANVILYYSVTNNNKLTLDMDGYLISTNKTFTNRGELTITNGNTEKEAVIKSSSAINIITNTNKLRLENVTIKNNSSNSYVINNTNDLTMVGTKIDSMSGVNSSNKLTISNANIRTTRTGINNTGELSITNGTYQGNNYSIYSNTNKEVSINSATLNGTFYNSGNNTSTLENSTLNGSMQSYNSRLSVEESNLNGSVQTSGTVTINESNINGSVGGVVSNSGTLTITDTNIRTNSNSGSYEFVAIANSGTLNITNGTIDVDKDSNARSGVIGINNTNALNLNGVTINVGLQGRTSGTYKGIQNSGTAVLEGNTLTVVGGSTNYGVYENGNKITIKTGKVEAKEAANTYAIYINSGTYEQGVEDGSEREDADVSKSDPEINSYGTRGIGVKKMNGSFNFYDGIINATRYTKPEMTTLVEKSFEVTTYVNAITGNEFAWLEYIRDDYEHSDAVAKIGDTFYDTLELAVSKAENGDKIELIKSVTENIEIPNNLNVEIDMQNHSITGQIVNNGTLQIYDGSVQIYNGLIPVTEDNVETANIAVINNGTLIMGQDDGNVSSTSVRIISESLTLKQNGTFNMYDGYLEGNPSLDGEISEIADFSRIYTTRDDQVERKYLQSLSEDAIRRKETNLILEIDPNGGYYDENKSVQYKFLYYEDTYELSAPRKNGCNFVEWEINDLDAISGSGTEQDPYVITIGLNDINIKAKWEVREDTVAKIGNEYYTTLADAIFHAEEGDTIELLKNTTEDITIPSDKNITIDLGGKKVTGEFINLGILRITNGTIENEDGVGLQNKKTLTMGYNDGEIITDDVMIMGTTIGLQQDGQLNFYDGYIEGDVSLNGGVNSVPKGYFLYTEYNSVKECQRTYLIGNPENAVAVTEEGGTQYFFSLQDAINTATVTGNEIFIIRNFEASYSVEVAENADILINMNSYNITMGNTITNNGKLRIYDSSENPGSITSARTITNNGDLTIEAIEVKTNRNDTVMVNNTSSGTLKVKNATIAAQNTHAVYSVGHLSLLNSYELKSNNYALYTKGETDEITSGKIEGIETTVDLTISGTANIESKTSGVVLRGPATLTVNGGTITTINNSSGIYNEGGSSTIYVNEGATINAYSGLYCNSGNTNYYINGATITGRDIGARMQADNCHLTMNSGSITGTNYGIYTYGLYNRITINDGTVTATTNDGIRDERSNKNTTYSDGHYTYFSKINVLGGLVEGARHGIYDCYSEVTVENAEVKSNGSSNGNYGIQSATWTITTLNNNAFINSPNASGVYTNSGLTINEGSRIYAGNNSAYGIYGDYFSASIRGGEIEVPGSSSYGLYDNNNVFSVTITGGSIKSGNIGISLQNSESTTKELYVYGGSIEGANYGIYQTQSVYKTTIGKSTDELSTTIPYITGGLYGYYKTAGTSYFYNGRLRGYTYGYNSLFNNIRSKMDIAEYVETDETINDIKTFATTNVSGTATKDYAKTGNGYARITYIGEDNDICTNGQVETYDYSGSEQFFTAPCEGKYSLEVWGAQGGSYSNSKGGYGGYSYGEVELLQNETLYINVGGQGATTSSAASQTAQGGYNGGGNGFNNPGGTGRYAGGGGGATHIATQTGLLASLENSRDSILIVAGGGGGIWYNSGSYQILTSGDGGGYIGNSSTSTHSSAKGGTQNSGYAFGKAKDIVDSEQPGAGGGYYAGYSSTFCAGGGSGYIGNSRLSNKYMYGYNVALTPSTWINNYLIEKDNFLQTNDGEVFNSIDDASTYILENLDGEGTITVIKDAMIQETETFVAGTTITFDLAGHTLTTTKRMFNNANLTIVDSSLDKSGLIDDKLDDVIQNQMHLTIDGAHLLTSALGYAVVYGNNASGSITVTGDSKLDGGRGLLLNTAHTVNMDSGSINATVDGIEATNAASTINITGGTINCTDVGIRLQVNNNTLNITDATIKGNNYGIYNNYQNQTVNITNSTITATSNDGMRFEASSGTRSTITINDSTITGARYGIYNRYGIITLEDTTVTTTSTNTGHFAMYTAGSADVYLNDNAIITAQNASAMYSSGGISMVPTSKISTSASSAVALRGDWIGLTMNGGTIEATGTSSNAITPDSNSYCSITLNDGEIKGTNIGINLSNSTSNSTRVVNIYGGSIEGTNYGIYQTTDYTVNIGKSTEALSTTTPYITGGKFGYYKTSGIANYYSGKLRGYHFGYSGDITNIREKKTILTEVESDDGIDETINTGITLNKSVDPTSSAAKLGDGYAKITYVSTSEDEPLPDDEGTIVPEINCNETVGDTYTFESINDTQKFIAKCGGKYKLEVWGGQGGYRSDSNNGGKGGYASGVIELQSEEELIVVVGSSGNNAGVGGGYNGGGSRDIGHGGGGATDIRLTDSLYTRILVAGGGGSDGASNKPGGYGGGTNGQSRGESYGSGGSGASQTGGGSYRGAFGQGGYGKSASGGHAGAGGGGWYGGGGADPDGSSDDDRGGGGGSGFAYNENSSLPTGYEVSERYMLTETVLKSGADSMPTHDGTSTMVGNMGDGYARITYVESYSGSGDTSSAKKQVVLKTSIGYIEDDILYYNFGDTLGNIPAPVVEDSGYTFMGWYLDQYYNNKVTSETIINTSTTLYAKFIYNSESCASNLNKTYEFSYTGKEEYFNVPCSGTYKLEVWGAQGGKAVCDSVMCGEGGYGGYSYGNINLSKNEKLYINVGGKGKAGSLFVCADGGYNGGGYGITDGGTCGNPNDDEAGGGGGGATHIATKSGLLSTLENDIDKILIVAGGGGGASWSNIGGSGGGNTGGKTFYTSSNVVNQETGYAFGQGQNGTGARQGTCTTGSSTSCSGVAGAGGGFYGGYVNDIEGKSSGQGGSGYISNSRIYNGYMYQYLLDIDGVWVINYLGEREGYLQVGNETYASFEEAIGAINDTGTIIVLKDIEAQDLANIPSSKNITIDLNGKSLVMNGSITNEGTLTMISSVPGGKLTNKKTNPIINKGNLVLNSGEIYAPNNSVIYGNAGTGTITVNDIKLTGSTGIYITTAQTITYNSGLINASNHGILLESTGGTLTVEGGQILSAQYAVRNNGESNNVVVNGGSIVGSGTGIYDDKSKNTSRRATIQINGGIIQGGTYGIYAYYDIVNLDGGEVSSLSTNSGNYALYCNDWATCTLNDGAVVRADKASGVYSNSTLVVNSASIYAGGASAYGIRVYSSPATIDGATINAPGLSAYGIYASNNASTINILDVDLKSGNVGILIGNDSTTGKTLNIYSGSIVGKTYGIYQTNSNGVTVIGDSTKENSITNPSIEGSIYGVYKTNGTLSMYSGVLKGYTSAYSAIFNNIREGYEIFENTTEASSYLVENATYSVDTHSEVATSETPKEGNGYAKITFTEAETLSTSSTEELVTNTTDKCSLDVNKEYTYSSIGEIQKFIPECSGKYKIEAWGAQGGYRSDSSKGGKGAYVSGYINLTAEDELLLYVGASGNNGGWNGGGTRTIQHGGGGATDVRLNESLYSRILVAAGGGSDGSSSYGGGYGGGPNGQSNLGGCGSGGEGATLTSGGGYRSSFGQGGNGENWSSGYGGAGGGGWYGGGGANPDSSADDDKGGGGGSSFIYNENYLSYLPATYMAEERFMFTDISMLSGGQKIPSYDGSSEMTGNGGDGFIKITYIKPDITATYKVKLVTHEGTLENDLITYRYNEKIGILETPTVTDSSLVFQGWYLDQDYSKKISPDYKVNSNLTLYARFTYNNEYCQNLVNTVYNFDYSGAEESLFIKCPGKYKLEVWGAQGGNTTYNSNSNTGGYGGYTTSELTLNQNEILYINVGGQGQSVDYRPSESIQTFDTNTGYNGGGYAALYSNNSSHGGGGGATHIATVSGKLNSLSNRKDKLLIVAGGGGGASTHSSYPSYSGDGGAGGGYIGGSGITNNTTCYNYGTGGTQASGGTYTACANDGRTSRDSSPSNPSFGYGSNYSSSSTSGVYSGGGAGLYGGQSGYHAPGGGGSGYNGNPRTYNTKMYGYNVNALLDRDTNMAYLIEETEFIYNRDLDRSYTNLQAAFDNARTGDTLELTKNASVTSTATLGDKSITIDLKGFELVATRTITNNGTINFVNSVEEIEAGEFDQGYDYTGYEEELTIPYTGNYKIEAWGAQGGDVSSYRGGYGGYSTGELYLQSGQKLYINVGSKPSSETGGYNGGGAGTSNEYGDGAGGGGATHVATVSGLLSTLENDVDSVLIVAGAGGGATNEKYSGVYDRGGHGGGMNGSVPNEGATSYTRPTAGTQTGPGTNTDSRSAAPGFGLGGDSMPWAGGGGAGYYGGGGGDGSGGAGGSGYIGNSDLTNKVMYCYYCTESSDEDTKTVTTTNVSSTATSNYAKQGNGYVRITKIDEEAVSNHSRIYSNLSITLIQNNGTLNIDGIPVNAYNAIAGGNGSVTNISNTSVTSSNNAINSNGTVSVNNSTITGGNRAIYASGGVSFIDSTITGSGYGIESYSNTTIDNSTINTSNRALYKGANGTLSITNSSRITSSSNTAVENLGAMTIEDSTITGSSYGVYNNTTEDSNIEDATISSGSNAIYNQAAGKLVILDTSITGNVTNNNASGTLNITNEIINGWVNNKGQSTISNVTISYNNSYYYDEQLINNSGVLTLSNNNITFNSTYNGSSNYDTRIVYNSGTLTSSDNNYVINNTYYKKHIVGIWNGGLLTSNRDSIEANRGNYSYGIYNNSSNTATVNDVDINLHNVNSYSYGIQSYAGTLSVTDSYINVHDGANGRGLYTNNTGNILTTNTNYEIVNNSSTSYGTVMDAGTITVNSGTFNVTSTNNADGINITGGTQTIKSGTFNVTSTNEGTGVRITGGTGNIESGSFIANSGTNAFGIKMTNGTINLGIEDGRGTDAADVSITDPYFIAVGTNEGTGISMGNGTFNYFDGKLVGSTRVRVDGDIVSTTELNYELKEHTDEETGYKYCILEFIK